MAGRKETALNLAKFVDKGVQVKLTGGRQVTGTLKGYDLLLNLVLDEAVESEREGELEELEKGVEPAWERLVHPLERIVDRMNVVDHIKAVKDSPDLCAAVEDVQVVSSSVTPPVIWTNEAVDWLAHHQMMMLSLYFLLLHELILMNAACFAQADKDTS
ncbi:uncharacterized protein [Aegilops tauschii subsp. strangulata]|uniref:uncharacterized protein n=1 Tax=Aegilops tauschii subsp. strangulata TaxID=200361 RepID=UPI001ABCF2FD|nr:uncharacterized protein LOC120962034 isoform X1 [Aegilops tauschii subsp. strangulata]